MSVQALTEHVSLMSLEVNKAQNHTKRDNPIPLPDNTNRPCQTDISASYPHEASHFQKVKKLSEMDHIHDVWLVTHTPSGIQYVMKTLQGNRAGKAELKLHRQLRHKHIPRMCGFFTTKTPSSYEMVCEFVPGGSLASMVLPVADRTAASYIAQLCSALRYLHSPPILHAHCDVKLSNLLFDGVSHVKLCDFGLAVPLGGEVTHLTTKGTLSYLAPEVTGERLSTGDMRSAEDATKIDVWAVGVCAYELLVGHVPFQKRDSSSPQRHETLAAICHDPLVFPPPSSSPNPSAPGAVTAEAKAFITLCCAKDPKVRPAMSVVSQHPWLVASTK